MALCWRWASRPRRVDRGQAAGVERLRRPTRERLHPRRDPRPAQRLLADRHRGFRGSVVTGRAPPTPRSTAPRTPHPSDPLPMGGSVFPADMLRPYRRWAAWPLPRHLTLGRAGPRPLCPRRRSRTCSPRSSASSSPMCGERAQRGSAVGGPRVGRAPGCGRSTNVHSFTTIRRSPRNSPKSTFASTLAGGSAGPTPAGGRARPQIINSATMVRTLGSATRAPCSSINRCHTRRAV